MRSVLGAGWVVARAALLACACAFGCGVEADFELPRRGFGREPFAASSDAAPDALLLSWNLEWFQHPGRGPGDDALQFEGAREVLADVRASLVALQEVSDAARLQDLAHALQGYDVVVTDHAWPQQLALLYDSEAFELLGSHPVLGLDDAGRPPLAVSLRAAGGARLTVIVVHAKAGRSDGDWTQRERFGRGLARHLEGLTEPGARLVLGDFNDRLSGSIVQARASPYAGLVREARLAAPTAALERGAEPSTLYGDTVDHILVGEELETSLRAGAADVLRDELQARDPGLRAPISDHFPVTLRLVSPPGWAASCSPPRPLRP